MKYKKTVIFLFLVGLVCITISSVLSQVSYPDYCNVFFFPHEIEPKDILQDGIHGPVIPITEKTLLVWVDMEPEMDFTHPVSYILISEQKIRIEEGKWRPVLNGKEILYNEIEKYTILSPYILSSLPDPNSPVEYINIHIFPHELTLRDTLTDGPSKAKIPVYPNTLLIWVDLMPTAKFVHPTAYVLVSKHGSRVEKGEWWPVLNGKQICYGEQNQIGVISPFRVERLLFLDQE